MAAVVGTSVFTNDVSSDTTVVSPAKNVTSGNLLVAKVSWEGTGVITGATDNASNTWAIAVQRTHSGGEPSCGILYAMNVTGDAALVVTVAFSASVTVRSVLLSERSGIATSSALEDSDSDEGTGTTFSTPDLTTTVGGVMDATIGNYQVLVSPTAGGSPTATRDAAGDGLTNFSIYYLSATGQTITPGASYSALGDRWVMVAAAFKDAGGGGGGGTRGMPFGSRGTAFNGGRPLVGIIR